MAKGAVAKQAIIDKILATFEGAFIDDKVVRIPWKEDGVDVEIKCALTCAKECIGGAIIAPRNSEPSAFDADPEPTPAKIEVTAEEKENVKKLIEVLGL